MYLLLLAVAPAAGLLFYVWNKDRDKKEPASLLFLLLFMGVVSALPAAILETILSIPINAIFGIDDNSTLVNDGFRYVGWAFVDNFFGVALVEEGFKLLFLWLITRNNKHFDSLFDGMIYAVFVSLGFAAIENVLYVFEGGIPVALMRAVMSVPGHMFFAVFMGYYYSMWHLYKAADFAEQSYARNGLIVSRPPRFEYKKYMVAAIAIPTAVHGFYDFCLTIDNIIVTLAVLAFLISLYFVCFSRIKKLAKADLEDYKLVPLILCAKYPQLIGVVSPKSITPTYTNMSVDEAVAIATEHAEQQRKEEEAAKIRAYYQQQAAMAAAYQQQYQQQYARQQYPQPQYPQQPQYQPQQQYPQYNPQPTNPQFNQPTNPQYQPPQYPNYPK